MITPPPPPTLTNACVNQTGITGGRLNAGIVECLAEQNGIWLSIPAVNAHSSMAITIGHGTGNVDLFYRNGGWPNSTTFDASSTNIGNNECIYINNITSTANYWGYVNVSGVGSNASIVVDFDTAGCRELAE
jgi:microbial collagenase